ncbi:metallophosphoesterase [Halobacteria archaeon AArc-m2/3/4]|uniref:Metallophosphoesterase n=1 Tax=Natronoglomus mannanivorans TaxID=2979990 RepID=A0AAP2YZF0_9EURY|nr:metallophosphoesterase [Halobacteria archaeon AArc-xg1-1]MCU4973366.1 metallophosphoesterase [Halobacteria archaeon AArc-m2/3/4]
MTDVDVSLPFTPLERAVYVPDAATLVLADTHFGRGEAANVEAPLGDGTDVIERLRELLERCGPELETVVVAGDLLHSFSRVPRGVEESLSSFVAAVADATLVVTPGNHDTMLESVEAYDGETVPEYRLADGETVVCHGHEPPEASAERYVVGHDHPALSIEGRKRPCFLYGPDAYDGADVLVLPAFTRIAPGSTVNGMRGRDFQSPLVVDADVFHPGVRDDTAGETLWFPPLGECRRLL